MVIVAYDDAQILDVACPSGALENANLYGAAPPYAIELASISGRGSRSSSGIVLAGGRPRAQASLFVSYAGGHEVDNKGEVDTESAARTWPNPQNRQSIQALGKAVFTLGSGNVLRGIVEIADNDIETQAFSSRGVTVTDCAASPSPIAETLSLTVASTTGAARTTGGAPGPPMPGPSRGARSASIAAVAMPARCRTPEACGK